MEDYNFDRVKEFKYLGTMVTDDTDGTEEITRGIQASNKCLYATQNVLKSKQVSRRAKINIYKTIRRPVYM